MRKLFLLFVLTLVFAACEDKESNKDKIEIESTYENVRVEIIQ